MGAFEDRLAEGYAKRDNLYTANAPVNGAERSIDEEAHDLVYGDRQASYGHPGADFTATGRIWGGILGRIDYVAGEPISPHTVALMMTGLKLSRESANPKRDNRVDGIGYWLCADRIAERDWEDNGCSMPDCKFPRYVSREGFRYKFCGNHKCDQLGCESSRLNDSIYCHRHAR